MKFEEHEQVTVVEYCEWNKIPIFAIPNGGSRNKIEAANMKRAGVRAGVPDLMIPIPKGKYHGLFIEMKVGKNKPTDNQKKWIRLLIENGYAALVCYGSQEAINMIGGYMNL